MVPATTEGGAGVRGDRGNGTEKRARHFLGSEKSLGTTSTVTR